MTIVSSTVFSCKRQTIEEPHDSQVEIPIIIDWSLSGLIGNYATNVSIYIYPEDGGEPYINIKGNIDSTSVKLPAGVYSALIINDFIDDIDDINFYDANSYINFSALVNESEATSEIYYQLQDGDSLISKHDRLAAWRLDDFEVISDIENCVCGVLTKSRSGINDFLNVQPLPVTVLNSITARISNLNNAMIIEGVLKGSANGANIATNSRIPTYNYTNVYVFDFESRTYDDTSDPVNGTISASVVTFGKQPYDDATYELDLDIVLNSGELVTFTRDVTDQVIGSEDFNIIIDLTDQDQLISLPEYTSSGFGVESWGDSEHVDLY